MCEDLVFKAYDGLAGGVVQYDVIFRALIVLQRKSGAVLRL